MNRMIRAAAAAALLTSGMASVGCVHTGGGKGGDGHGPLGDAYRNAVDPCYPERYNYAAREAVIYPFAQQVHNGHVLNQTVFPQYFEPGTDKLNAHGMQKLDSLAQTRPAPDPKLFLQTARDLPPNTDPARIADARAELDGKRAAAIQKYMASQPAFGAPVAYEIWVLDAPAPGVYAELPTGAYRGSFLGYRGGITGAAGIGALSTGGGGSLVNIQGGQGGAANAPGAAAGPGGSGTGGTGGYNP